MESLVAVTLSLLALAARMPGARFTVSPLEYVPNTTPPHHYTNYATVPRFPFPPVVFILLVCTAESTMEESGIRKQREAARNERSTFPLRITNTSAPFTPIPVEAVWCGFLPLCPKEQVPGYRITARLWQQSGFSYTDVQSSEGVGGSTSRQFHSPQKTASPRKPEPQPLVDSVSSQGGPHVPNLPGLHHSQETEPSFQSPLPPQVSKFYQTFVAQIKSHLLREVFPELPTALPSPLNRYCSPSCGIALFPAIQSCPHQC